MSGIMFFQGKIQTEQSAHICISSIAEEEEGGGEEGHGVWTLCLQALEFQHLLGPLITIITHQANVY